jgi:hypothetical protein
LDGGGGSVGEAITGGSCSRDILGETAREAIEEESENIVLPEASLSNASSSLSSALSVVLSASAGIRLGRANLGARSESFTGRGAASTWESPEWSANTGFRTGEMAFAVVGVECGESGPVVEITGIGMPPNVVRCVSSERRGVLFKDNGGGFLGVDADCEGSAASLENEDKGVSYAELD